MFGSQLICYSCHLVALLQNDECNRMCVQTCPKSPEQNTHRGENTMLLWSASDGSRSPGEQGAP